MDEQGGIKVERVFDLDNRKIKEPHGSILARIFDCVVELAPLADIFVRERGFSCHAAGTQTLFKVVGVADMALWITSQDVFQEIAPTSVKKHITGKGSATKAEVAEALRAYVGAVSYASDDQSDAVAIGVAWVLEQSKSKAE